MKVEFLVIDEKDIDKLTHEKDRYVAFAPENGKIKLVFLPQNKDYVLHCLYPNKHQAESDNLFSVTRNSKVNTRLKSEALLNGKQMRYRTLTKVEIEELHKQTGGHELFAVFSNGKNGQEEKYNVAYKEDDEKKIDSIIGTQSKPIYSDRRKKYVGEIGCSVTLPARVLLQLAKRNDIILQDAVSAVLF